MKTEEIAGKILTCPNCGSEEFKINVSQYDIVKIVNGRLEFIRSEEPFADDELLCAECGEEMPPLNEAGDKFDLSASSEKK